MKYRKDKYGNDISVLGFGCMRFTGRAGRIDIDKAEREIMAAYKAGVNYYDTAYIYSGSEAAIGEIFERNGIRDEIYIATKLPHYMVRSAKDFDRIFDEELKRLRTDHVDYYLIHMLNDIKSWERALGLGIADWIKKQRESGRIRQIGFSYHGNSDSFMALLDAYDWDFCQIQYNYLDENTQAGRSGYEYAAARGIPVVIMEPLRGGKLANKLPQDALREFEAYNLSSKLDRTPAEWAFHWLWNHEGIMTVLSGMNSIEMVEENCESADKAEAGSLSEAERDMFDKVVSIIRAGTRVGCTGCRYCMPCPRGVDIPGIFSAYNNRYIDGWMSAEKEYLMCTTLRKKNTAASNCVGCRKCEEHCPQHIKVSEELVNARKVLEGPIYKIVAKFAPLLYR